MSILIKTMTNLPEHCYDCPCHDGESGYCKADKEHRYSDYRPFWCPLVKIESEVLDDEENGLFPKGHERKFEEIVVEYPPKDLCIYPEYRGKTYFSIKYEENGEHFIGFGTYNPEVFSKYLKEYFIEPTIIKVDKESE